MINHSFQLRDNVLVTRPDGSFSGVVAEIRGNWLRIIGAGSVVDSVYNEWFAIEAPKSYVIRTSRGL